MLMSNRSTPAPLARARLLPACALLFAACGCGPKPALVVSTPPVQSTTSAERAKTAGGDSAEPPFRLVEVSAARGLNFTHECSPRSPLTIVETMGSGCAFYDFDNDGWQDILLVNAGQDFKLPRQKPGTKLFRNTGDGNFVDVTEPSGLAAIDGYAMGCCIGDYDNDGYDDLFVSGFGRNWLFRNEAFRHSGAQALGESRPEHPLFRDVTKSAGILQRPGAWGIGCAFVDIDRDGWLDLYVGNYIRYDPKIPFCLTANVWHGCTPNQYSTQASELYLNQRNGKFVERAAALGADDAAGASLGVLTCDFDNDGWMDIFIANDGTPNTLLHNRKGRFRNIAQESGVAYGEDGGMRAGMGTDAGDVDGDGRFDLTITNFQHEATSVYRNLGKMHFIEISYPSGVGTASLGHLKFGVAFVDLDGDGDVDLYQGNGHVHDNVSLFNDIDTFEQIDQVYLNLGEGKFKEVSPSTGAFPDVKSVTRAVAIGDFNNDGRMDILLNSLGRPVRLLENQSPKRGPWVGLKLIGTRGNRSAIGARVELRGPGWKQVREVRSGGSYIGQSDLRVLFNLGQPENPAKLSLHIRWPNGAEQTLRSVTLDRYVTLHEPRR